MTIKHLNGNLVRQIIAIFFLKTWSFFISYFEFELHGIIFVFDSAESENYMKSVFY